MKKTLFTFAIISALTSASFAGGISTGGSSPDFCEFKNLGVTIGACNIETRFHSAPVQDLLTGIRLCKKNGEVSMHMVRTTTLDRVFWITDEGVEILDMRSVIDANRNSNFEISNEDRNFIIEFEDQETNDHFKIRIEKVRGVVGLSWDHRLGGLPAKLFIEKNGLEPEFMHTQCTPIRL